MGESRSWASIAGQSRLRLARLLADGSADLSFANLIVDASINGFAIQSSGKIIIVGDFTQVAAAARNRIARLNADGSLDGAFNAGADASVLSVGGASRR